MWSFAAIEEADHLFPGRRIFEWGSGGSTLRYAQMGCRITAIEDDHEWLDATRQALAAAGVASRVDLQHVPFDFDHPENFPESRYCQALADDLWDVVIIDGQDKTFRGRISCFRHAEPLMRLGASSSLTTFGVMKMNCLSAIRLKMLKFLSRSALVELV